MSSFVLHLWNDMWVNRQQFYCLHELTPKSPHLFIRASDYLAIYLSSVLVTFDDVAKCACLWLFSRDTRTLLRFALFNSHTAETLIISHHQPHFKSCPKMTQTTACYTTRRTLGNTCALLVLLHYALKFSV